jgi:hypothetical protein
MSQSDYLKYKRVSTELQIQKKSGDQIPPVLTSQNYISYKGYSLENTIINDKTIYHQLTPVNTQIIFDIATSDASSCPQPYPIMCGAINNLSNRVPLSGIEIHPRPPRYRIQQNRYECRYKKADGTYVTKYPSRPQRNKDVCDKSGCGNDGTNTTTKTTPCLSTYLIESNIHSNLII